jgi:3-oxoacyl-[acyl-carrier-protein] synthase III
LITEIEEVEISRIINIEGNVIKKVSDYFDNEAQYKRVSSVTGITEVSVFSDTSILPPFLRLAEEYFSSNRSLSDVVGVIVVSQTRDYLMPNMSIVLADRLGLSTSLVCIDLPFGCSGFGNGLYQAMLMARNLKGRVLVFLGDKITPFLGDDMTLLPVFSEAASLVEVSPVTTGKKNIFDIFVDGRGEADIAMSGSIFGSEPFQLTMNGTKVLNFAMSEVPKSISRLLDSFVGDVNSLQGVYLHQANKFVVDKVKRRLPAEIPKELVFNDSRIGNSGPSSIPMLIQHINGTGQLSGLIITSGFGVGWSICSNIISLNGTEIIEVKNGK